MKMVLGNGFIQIKLLMKASGQVPKKMVKELKLGLMDISIKVSLKIVNGVE